MSVSVDVLDKDIRSIAAESDDPSKVLNTSNPTDVSRVAIDSDDTIQAVTSTNNPSSTPKTFAIYPTKRVVEEISQDPIIPETHNVESLSKESLTAIETKTSIKVTDDIALSAAEEKVISDFIAVTNDQFSMKASFETLTETTVPEIDEEAIEALDSFYTTDPVTAGIIPSEVPTETFGEMQQIFTDVLKAFNVCPDLDSVFALGNQSFNLTILLSALLKFLNLGGMFDISAFFSCFPDLIDKLGIEDKLGLFDSLVKNGSIDSFNALAISIPASTIPNPKDISVELIKSTELTTDNVVSLDTALSTLGITNKETLLAVDYETQSQNPLNGMTTPIFDLDKAADENLRSYAVTDYAASLLGNLPA